MWGPPIAKMCISCFMTHINYSCFAKNLPLREEHDGSGGVLQPLRTCLAGMAVDIPCHDLVAIYHGSLRVFYTSTSHYKSTWLYILNHF